MTSTLRFAATTHVGRVRKANEDSILALPDQNIWVVSDGMGGHIGGGFASQTVVEAITMLPTGQTPGALMVSLREAMQRAHDIIQQEAAAQGGRTMGATVVSLVIADDHFAAFWAGDSRLYRLQSGEIEMLTTDHSTVAELVLSGDLTWDQAEQHPQSNAITRAIGVGDVLEIDKIRGEVFPGDRFLLCSDGLTKYATFDTLERILKSEPLETVAETLQQLALDRGGADNVSVIVVDAV